MKIWHISDTHGYHGYLKIPENIENIDVIVHSGDCSNSRSIINNREEVLNFIEWYSSIPVKYKIYVAGNHDTSIENNLITANNFTNKGIIYLENASIEIGGFNFYGSPYTPSFGNWSFMKSRNKLNGYWEKLKSNSPNIDVLITHGPPRRILDSVETHNFQAEFAGDSALFNFIKDTNPKLSLFGHIHSNISNLGTAKLSQLNLNTIFSNGSCVMDGRFRENCISNGNILEI